MIFVDDLQGTYARLHVSSSGPWFAEVDLADESELSGAVTLKIGEATFAGTIRAANSGSFGLRSKILIVAGGDGWGKLLPAKPYHNDAGVKARTVAEDAARESGETLGDFAGNRERLGAHFLREAGEASRAIRAAATGASWFVDYEGITHVGARSGINVPDDAYELLDFDPRDSVAALGVDNVAAFTVGDILAKGLDEPRAISELEIIVAPERARVYAYLDDSSRSELGDSLTAIVESVAGRRLLGIYRYRVVKMTSDRVDLQIVKKSTGIPDAPSIPMAPGIPSAHAQLAAGAEVFVQFVNGDRADPIITGFGGRSVSGHVADRLDLGGDTAQDAARKGDAVEIALPPAVFSGTIGGAPASGVITFTVNKATGVVSGGSAKVGIA